jgi:CubicO group peptidase (beta-lactamase class C family)
MISQQDLQARLDALAGEYKVTGASVAVSQGATMARAHHGMANLATDAPVRADTLFAAGSVTKVLNASLVMTLVDEGRLDLDAPIAALLPEFEIAADMEASRRVTARMLLTHTAGLPGYAIYDLQKGPDVLERAVARINRTAFDFPPGRYWSYSNAGMVVAGRLVEVLTGLTWDAALAQRILAPLEINGTTSTEEMILTSTAVGHLFDSETGRTTRVPRFQLDDSNGPAGSSLWIDAEGLNRFARMHLDKGVGGGGRQVLSAAAIAEMQRPQVDAPWGPDWDHWGLGWSISGEGDQRTLSHGGGNSGSNSYLVIAPAQDASIAVLTNSNTGMMLSRLLANGLLAEVFGVGAPVRQDLLSAQAAPAGPEAGEAGSARDLGACCGTYKADRMQAVVSEQDGGLGLRLELEPDALRTMQLMGASAPPPMTLAPVGSDGRFVSEAGMPVRFIIEPDSREPAYVYVGSSIYHREPS